MAGQIQPQPYHDFSLDYENCENCDPSSSLGSPSSFSDSPASGRYSRSVLEELNADGIHNIPHKPSHPPTATPYDKHLVPRDNSTDVVTPESLAEELQNFHIHSPSSKKDGNAPVEEGSAWKHDFVQGGSSPTESPTTQSPSFPTQNRLHFLRGSVHEGIKSQRPKTSDLTRQESASLVSASIPDTQLAIEKHSTEKFDWVLSLPFSASELIEGAEGKHLRRGSTADVADQASEDRKFYFGCNLLKSRSRSGSDLTGQRRIINTYTLVATPLGANVTEKLFQAKQGVPATAAAPMADAFLTPDGTASAGDMANGESIPVSPKLLGEGLEGGFGNRSPSLRSHSSSVSRIEDTIEELDRLEDQFEAVNSMVHVDRVPSPDKATGSKAARAGATGTKKLASKTAPARGKATETRRGTTVGRPKATTPQTKKQNATTPGSAASAASKRQSLTRPTSLQPPKPPIKSTKPLTVPTFELPGDAVARRLKEQREKRMSAAIAAADVPAVPTLRRTRSTRPPTIPTFELPGEAISRRKREEHEAKIKQQEEEERKRREFKARPIRTSNAPSTYPRDTITSRARQKRMSVIGEKSPVGGKRLSVVSAASSSLSPGPHVPRGRNSALGSASAAALADRAQSTSTGSVSGKRSTMSTEDVQNQKLRGKAICHRDNLLSVDRDREKHEREEIAKKARQEAAERSRKLSREWAEKQKQRAKKLVSAVTGAKS